MSDEPDFALEPTWPLLDADPVTTVWPMPEAKPLEPIPPQSLWARAVSLWLAMWEAGTA